MISMIAVIGKNRELGKDNKLLWNIPEDLKRFREITSGHPIIMGRKTFQSIGRPLPGRTNIVITSNPTHTTEGIMSVSSLNEALSEAAKAPGNEEIFIIGGGTIYAQAIGFAKRLYLTIVDASAEADTYFPDYSAFTTVISTEQKETAGLTYSYTTLETT